MTIGITGANSTIAQHFERLIGDDHVIKGQPNRIAHTFERYLVCTGYLAGATLREIRESDYQRTWSLNFIYIARMCDRIFANNPVAKICVMGSESGFSGSHDMAYAGAKAAMHLYVKTKHLTHPDQMIVALAPHIIMDTGMTQRRDDHFELEQRAKCNRMGRWLNASEVAAEAYRLLYHSSPAISGQVIRMRP